jgi:CRISPR type III-B/RAMP module RAMP protein Cmr6
MNVCALQKVRDLLGGDAFPKCESASLRLEKYVRVGDNTKKEEINDVVKKTQGRIPVIVPNGAVSFTAKLGGRLIVNQAGGVLENAGLCIHPHFNAPYIPGSAIKGCARHAAWQAWNEAEEGDAKIAAAKDVAEIFGYPTGDSMPKKKEDVEPGRVYLDEYLKDKCEYKEGDSHSGKVAFLAAVPETTAKLVVDIVNCHHKDYYADKETKPYATDDEAPIRNFFPAVEAGARFTFKIAPLTNDSSLLAKAKYWVVEAITVNGIGAKTAAGYGWFLYDEQAEVERERRIREEEEKRKKEEERAEAERMQAQRDAERRARRAAMSVEELWQEQGAAAICGKAGKTFESVFRRSADEKKDEIVKVLQQVEGVGAEVWNMLRTDKKRKNQNAVTAVFKWAKDRKLGRMPQ